MRSLEISINLDAVVQPKPIEFSLVFLNLQAWNKSMPGGD